LKFNTGQVWRGSDRLRKMKTSDSGDFGMKGERWVRTGKTSLLKRTRREGSDNTVGGNSQENTLNRFTVVMMSDCWIMSREGKKKSPLISKKKRKTTGCLQRKLQS